MKRTILTALVALLLAGCAPCLIAADLQPTNGCNASPSCRSNGFSVLRGNAGGHVLMVFGVDWTPTFHLGIITPPETTPGSDNGEPRFHLHAPSLLPPADSRPFESDFERHEDEKPTH